MHYWVSLQKGQKQDSKSKIALWQIVWFHLSSCFSVTVLSRTVIWRLREFSQIVPLYKNLFRIQKLNLTPKNLNFRAVKSTLWLEDICPLNFWPLWHLHIGHLAIRIFGHQDIWPLGYLPIGHLPIRIFAYWTLAHLPLRTFANCIYPH